MLFRSHLRYAMDAIEAKTPEDGWRAVAFWFIQVRSEYLKTEMAKRLVTKEMGND